MIFNQPEVNYHFIKRTLDILLSLFALIVATPLFALIAVLIKLTSPGPVFYRSKRMGKDYQVIDFLKFRTMTINAEKALQRLLEKDSRLKEEWETFLKLKKDPRVTQIGCFLRKTSLDELPQFINVLKGDLSIVGPRPFALMGPKQYYHEEIQSYLGEKAKAILSIKPGITGPWQTSGRNEIPLNKRLEIEAKYVQNRSLLRDLAIILKTIPLLFFPKGAY